MYELANQFRIRSRMILIIDDNLINTYLINAFRFFLLRNTKFNLQERRNSLVVEIKSTCLTVKMWDKQITLCLSMALSIEYLSPYIK